MKRPGIVEKDVSRETWEQLVVRVGFDSVLGVWCVIESIWGERRVLRGWGAMVRTGKRIGWFEIWRTYVS